MEPYMAPEMVSQKKGHYTEKVDIYSCGILMWTIATNGSQPPYLDQSSEAGLRIRPRVDTVQWKELSNIMEKCWEFDAEKRPTAREVLRMLESMPDASQLLIKNGPPVGLCCSIS